MFTTAKFGSTLASTPSNPTVIGATANMAYTFGAAVGVSNGDNDGKLVHGCNFSSNFIESVDTTVLVQTFEWRDDLFVIELFGFL